MGQEALAPGKKNARRRRAWIVFQDESGFSLLPSVRATWAPRGETPVLWHHFRHWTRLSMAAALCYRPQGPEAALVFGTIPGAYNDEALIEFLTELHHHLDDGKVTLIWDGLPSHRSRKMKRFLASKRRWLVVEPLPAYAYDLNPVEQVWGNLKGTELANLCADTIEEAVRAADAGLCRIGGETHLCRAFLRHSGLEL